jgi:hypothetical protein
MKILEYCKYKIDKDCDVKRHRLCAIAFSKSGQIITSAVNRIHNDGYVSDYSLHAEELLLKKLRKIKAIERFRYIKILVVRFAKAKGWAMAKPCRNCESLLKLSGVQEVSYTDEFGTIQTLY